MMFHQSKSNVGCLSRCMPHLRLRFYATVPAEPFFHKDWPQHTNPSPYDVLGLPKDQLDSSKLKRRYFELAKLYHPDTGGCRTLVNHKGLPLTDEHKDERFRLLSDAYSLLRDPRKKALYDQHLIGWDGKGTSAFSSTPVYRTDYAVHRYDYNDQRYWNASTWEDYRDLRDMNDPALRKDKIRALVGIMMIIMSGAAIQGWMFINSMESTLVARQEVHDTCEGHLSQAYLNYGLDSSQIGRIRRFLWFRTFGTYTTSAELDAGAKQDELLLAEVMEGRAH